jgi:uronate dehydrogenase
MKRILLTGAAGNIGTRLRELLRGKYDLRLSDRAPIEELGEGETFARADLADLSQLVPLMTGIDGIVHLGGIPAEDTFENILHSNIVGTYNLFEAARQRGVKRVVFASTNHVVGFYGREPRITHDGTVRPDSRYGVSKAFGEALASLYADKNGAQVMCIRVGAFLDEPFTMRHLAMWVSPRDLTQLVEIGLEHPDLHFEIVYGVSENARSWWDNANAKRLGYAPRDNSEEYAAHILETEGENPEEERFRQVQGGVFAFAEDWEILLRRYQMK